MEHVLSVTEVGDGMTQDPDLKSLRMSIAALTRVAREGGRSISAPARLAFLDAFKTRHECDLCGVITVDQALPPAERDRAATAAMRVHFSRLAQRSALARRRARMSHAEAEAAEARLASELAGVDDAC
jgi:hypothetical protein